MLGAPQQRHGGSDFCLCVIAWKNNGSVNAQPAFRRTPSDVKHDCNPSTNMFLGKRVPAPVHNPHDSINLIFIISLDPLKIQHYAIQEWHTKLEISSSRNTVLESLTPMMIWPSFSDGVGIASMCFSMGGKSRANVIKIRIDKEIIYPIQWFFSRGEESLAQDEIEQIMRRWADPSTDRSVSTGYELTLTLMG